jgi:hypothetical protein
MNKLLESMDPQGVLNMADTDETTMITGVDPTKSGDAHATAHDVSLTDNSSNSRSGSGSTCEESGNRSENMEVSSPSFRIVDIEPRPSAQQIQVPLHGHADAVGMNPVPGLIPATTTAADGAGYNGSSLRGSVDSCVLRKTGYSWQNDHR